MSTLAASLYLPLLFLDGEFTRLHEWVGKGWERRFSYW